MYRYLMVFALGLILPICAPQLDGGIRARPSLPSVFTPTPTAAPTPTETPMPDAPESTTVPYEEGDLDSHGWEVTPYSQSCAVGQHAVYPVKEYDAAGEIVGEFYPMLKISLASGDADGDSSQDFFICKEHMNTMARIIEAFEAGTL